jgi:hypothetical protein
MAEGAQTAVSGVDEPKAVGSTRLAVVLAMAMFVLVVDTSLMNVSTTSQLEGLLKGKPPAVQDEIIRINTDARHDALQIALIVPLLAAVIGFLASFSMMRLPDPKPSEAAEMALV